MICIILPACKKAEPAPGEEYIVWISNTKTLSITEIPDNLFWCATSGQAGYSETQKYASTYSQVQQSKIHTGKYQTASPAEYNWYIANSGITFDSTGPTISITDTGTDYIAGYAKANSSTNPAVELRHILARTGTLSFNTQSGYELSDVSWTISRNVSGTRGIYNIARDSWSVDSSSMSPFNLTSSTNLYLIPGDYIIRVNYTLSREHYRESFSRSGSVTLSQGMVNNITASANGGSAFSLSVSPSLDGWNDSGSNELIMEDTQIHFDIKELPMDGTPQTKGAPVSSISSHGSMELYGYLFSDWSASCTPNYMSAEKATYDASGWASSSLYNTRVPDGQKLRIYGFSPYGAEGVVTKTQKSGALSFSYSSPESPGAQADLLTGCSADISGSANPVTMNYTHCLSAITFSTGSETVSGTVKSISVKGIYTAADYTIGSGWSDHASVGSRTITLNEPVSEGNAKILSSGENTFMLIPQAVPPGAIIEAVVHSDGSDHTLSASIAGSTWAEGHSYVYALSFDSIAGMKISATPSDISVSYGDEKRISVSADPSDQNWTVATSGSGFSVSKENSSSLLVTGTNCSGSNCCGTVTLTTQDGKRNTSISIASSSLQESVSLSPESLTIPYGRTGTLTASGTFPGGLSADSVPAGVEVVSIEGNTITLKNITSSYSTSTDNFSVKSNLMQSASNNVSVTLEAKLEKVSISPKTATIANGGSQEFTVSGEFDGYSATLSSSDHAGISTNGNTVTISNLNNTYSSKTVTISVSTTTQGASDSSGEITLAGLEDSVTGYSVSDISLSESSVGAGGGSISISGGSVTRIWASGKTDENYATAEFSCPGASVSANSVSLSSLGTQIKAATDFTVTASYSSGGISAENKTASFRQEENKITGRTEGSDHSHTQTGDVSYGEKIYVGSKSYSDKSYGGEYLGGSDYGAWSGFSGQYNIKSTENYDYAVNIVMDLEYLSDGYGSGDYGLGSISGKAGREIVFGGVYRRSVNEYLSSPSATARGTISAWHYERTPYQQRRERSRTDHYYRNWSRSATQGYERAASQACNYKHQYKYNYSSGAQDADWRDEDKSHIETWTDTGTDSVTGDSGSEWYRDAGTTEYDYQDTYTTPNRVEDPYSVVSLPSWLTVSTTNYIKNTTYSVSQNISSRRNGTLTVCNSNNTAARCSAEIYQSGKAAVIWVSGWDIDVHEVLNAKLHRLAGGIADGSGRYEENMDYVNGQYISVEEGSGITVAYCSYFTIESKSFEADEWTEAKNGTYLKIY